MHGTTSRTSDLVVQDRAVPYLDAQMLARLTGRAKLPVRYQGDTVPITIAITTMSFLTHLIERLPEGIQRTEDTILGPYLTFSLLSFLTFRFVPKHRGVGSEQ
jgi:hypothetical protein